MLEFLNSCWNSHPILTILVGWCALSFSLVGAVYGVGALSAGYFRLKYGQNWQKHVFSAHQPRYY